MKNPETAASPDFFCIITIFCHAPSDSPTALSAMLDGPFCHAGRPFSAMSDGPFYQRIGSLPTERRYSLAREKWRHPKNPR